jgi:hypothetical protein
MANHTIINCAQKETLSKIVTSLEFINKDRESVKELVNDKLTGIHAENMAQYDLVMAKITALHDVEMEQFKRITDRQDVANGRVTKLEIISENRNKELEGMKTVGREIIRYQKLTRWVANNPFKSLAIGLIVLFMMIVAASYIDAKMALDLMK